MQLPFGSYRRKVPGSAMRLLNVMAEQQPLAGKAPSSLIGCPGVRAHLNVGNGPGRGLGLHDNKLYAVSGQTLYRVPLSGEGGAAVAIAGSIAGSARVSMASNSIDLGIVANPNMYFLNGVTLTANADADFTSRGAVDIGFLDGYWTHVEPNSPRHFSSDLYARTYDALKFATAELSPDDLIGQLVNVRQATFFGKKSSEVWYNAGADNYPFEKASGGDIMLGALGGLALADNAEWFLANDVTVRVLRGSTPERKSTHAVEEALQKLLKHLKTAFAFSYVTEGHLIYVLTIPGYATWCFDNTTLEWHERESFGDPDWRVGDCLEVDGVTYAQDRATGKVGILDPAVYDEWGATMRAEWTYPSVYQNGRLFFHNWFELIMKAGVGLAAGQGSDPMVMLEYSDDGGRTWLSAPDRSIGKIGEHSLRVMWDCLGSSYDRVYRCSISDPVERAIFDTRVAAEPGDL